VAVGLFLLVGGALGAGAGLVGAVVAASRAKRRETGEDRAWDEVAPVVVDLIAAATRSGVPPEGAVRAAAEAVGRYASAGLRAVSEAWRYGLSAEGIHVDSTTRAIALIFERSRETGSAPAAALDHLGADLAADAEVRAQERARRVGVQAALPLGVCLLPAFLCLGVAPLVASLMSGLAS
jgi:Flp pilus assembly protein TadB